MPKRIIVPDKPAHAMDEEGRWVCVVISSLINVSLRCRREGGGVRFRRWDYLNDAECMFFWVIISHFISGLYVNELKTDLHPQL